MGQTNSKRVQFEGRVVCTSPQNDDKQNVDFTGYFEIGDVVDVIDVDAVGNIVSTLADNLTITAINPNVSLTLSAVVDTTLATGTPMIRVQQIDDAFEAIDRLYRRKQKGAFAFDLKQSILEQHLDTPILGQAEYEIDNAAFWRAGDQVDILADEGLVAANVSIVSVEPRADSGLNRATITLASSIDTSTFTNPLFLNKTINVELAIRRNQERIDGIDQPVENEDLGVGDNKRISWSTANLFVPSSTKLLMDGRRLKKGTSGTRAQLIQGAGNSALTFKSLILGTDGNATKVRVQAGAGLTVSVTGNYTSGFTVTINDNGGAATSAQIAAALNAHATVKSILQAFYGGTGAGVVATFGPTNLAGGLNNGTGDYAELEQVFENSDSGTGWKIVSLHIRPNEQNRLNSPPSDDEELVIDYRKASDNVNY